MNKKLIKGDREILSLIALYRILTVSQLAAMAQRSRQIIRRRLRYLSKKNLITTRIRGYGRSSGRPEDIVFLTEKTIKILHDQGVLPESAPLFSHEYIDAIAIDHELLINWFYIHLIQIEKSIPVLTVNPYSPGYLIKKDGNLCLFDPRIRLETDDDLIECIPDGIFTIWHKELKKGLLFFLEVDMNTEPKVSQNRNPKDIRQKILNYQTIFRNGHYKRFEENFHTKFNGFRLLFLTNSPARSISLSRLVQEMPPTDFIWLTNQEKMFSDGLSAEIWIRGEKIGTPPQSIINQTLTIQNLLLENIK